MPDCASTSAALAPRIHVITLGVSDLERALGFYRDGLGWPTRGIVGTQYPDTPDSAPGATVMFTLEDGLVLSLYPRSALAKDAGVDVPQTAGSDMSIGHIVGGREDVDRILEAAARAGARIIGRAHTRPWGIYSGYFSDLDGHLWEIICRVDDA